MMKDNVIAFPAAKPGGQAEAACFDAMLSEAIEGLRYRRATRHQREEKRLGQQYELNETIAGVLGQREDLAIFNGACLTIAFLAAGCQLSVEVNEEGQVDLSWLYESQAEPKYSGTVGLHEARDIVLHLVAVRLAAIHVDGEQKSVG